MFFILTKVFIIHIQGFIEKGRTNSAALCCIIPYNSTFSFTCLHHIFPDCIRRNPERNFESKELSIVYNVSFGDTMGRPQLPYIQKLLYVSNLTGDA